MFGRWLAIKEVEPRIYKQGHKKRMWLCECQCNKKTIKPVSYDNLINGSSKSCGCLHKEKKHNKSKELREGLIGKNFGNWTVIADAGMIKGRSYLTCKCSCEKETIREIPLRYLTSGYTTHCGCLASIKVYNSFHKENKYNLSDQYGIGWTTNTNKEFYFDLEDYDKIKNLCWMENKLGYINTHISKFLRKEYKNKSTRIGLHRLVMNCPEYLNVDHIYHKLYDNRKSQLRIVSSSQNNMNRILSKSNSSGYKGVCKSGKRWIATICVDYERKIKYFKTIEEAIKQRKEWEIEFFKEYNYKYNKEENYETLCRF